MCNKIKPFYLMVKTGNRIYKISVRKFTTNQNFISFYSGFFSQYTFNSDPEPEHLHFLPGNPKRPPPPPPPSRLTHFKSVSGLYISTENMYARKYISVCLSISFFPVCLKYQGWMWGWALCVCPRSCWFEEISVVSLFLLANRTRSMIIDRSLRQR